MPKRFDTPDCCQQGKTWVSWEIPVEDWREGEGPPREGWAMLVCDYCMVNVSYCPFCGKRLTNGTIYVEEG